MKRYLPISMVVVGGMAIGMLALLPGCGGSAEQSRQSSMIPEDVVVDDGSPVLATLNGKPIITMKTLERDFDQLLEENPQLKTVLPLMPDAKQNLLRGQVAQSVVNEYVNEHKINEREAYKKDLAAMMRSVVYMLNNKYFSLDHPVVVSDSEVKKVYEDNKQTMPDLIISRGGVKATGVIFNKEADAKAFLEKARGKEFAKAAADAGLANKVTDFKLVNEQTLGIDGTLRSKIVTMKKFPALEVVKVGDTAYWVVHATGSEAPTYRPFEQVKAELKQFVEKEKRMEAFEQEIKKLQERYKVTINEAPLGGGAPAQEEELALPEETKEVGARARTPGAKMADGDAKVARTARVA